MQFAAGAQVLAERGHDDGRDNLHEPPLPDEGKLVVERADANVKKEESKGKVDALFGAFHDEGQKVGAHDGAQQHTRRLHPPTERNKVDILGGEEVVQRHRTAKQDVHDAP